MQNVSKEYANVNLDGQVMEKCVWTLMNARQYQMYVAHIRYVIILLVRIDASVI